MSEKRRKQRTTLIERRLPRCYNDCEIRNHCIDRKWIQEYDIDRFEQMFVTCGRLFIHEVNEENR